MDVDPTGLSARQAGRGEGELASPITPSDPAPSQSGRRRAGMIRSLLVVLALGGCTEPIRTAGLDGGPPSPNIMDARPQDSGHIISSECSSVFTDRVEVSPPGGEARFQNIQVIAFDAKRNLYVLNREGSPETGYVTVLSPAPEHRLIGTYGRPHLGKVRGLAVLDSGASYVVEWTPPRNLPLMHRFSEARDHLGTFTLSGPNSANDQANGVLANRAQDALFVSGLILLRYQLDGTYVDGFGRHGTDRGELFFPYQMALDSGEHLWVTDLFRNAILKYDPRTGELLSEFGGRGSELGQFDGGADPQESWGPTSIAIDHEDNLYVNDPWSSRIQKLDQFGSPLGAYEFGGSRAVGALALEPRTGHIYVARDTAIDVVCPF